MSEICQWLHVTLERSQLFRYPFRLDQLPMDGIYFFYEDGEFWGHGGNRLRIVRIGTHKDGNFRSRIKEHFLMGEKGTSFDTTRPAPKDRSIFRKNIGRALLNKSKDGYLQTWEIDFMTRKNRAIYSHLRDLEKERQIESEVTKVLRSSFSFRFIPLESQARRMGRAGLESRLIGTVASCELCKPSSSWLGRDSPKDEIRTSGLWLVQHLTSPPITAEDRATILKATQSRSEKDVSL